MVGFNVDEYPVPWTVWNWVTFLDTLLVDWVAIHPRGFHRPWPGPWLMAASEGSYTIKHYITTEQWFQTSDMFMFNLYLG